MWETRMAPLSGALFALLLMAAFAVDTNTAFMPTELEVIDRLTHGPMRTIGSAYLGLLAAGALIWFSGSLHARARRTDERLAVIAMSGGSVGAATLIIGEVTTISAAERFMTSGSIDPSVAAALLDISNIAIGNGLPIGLAVMISAASICSLRAGQNRTIARAGVVTALGLLTPYGWAVLLVAALFWIPATGIAMSRSSRMRLAPAGNL